VGEAQSVGNARRVDLVGATIVVALFPAQPRAETSRAPKGCPYKMRVTIIAPAAE
jgi:hypothetical protein